MIKFRNFVVTLPKSNITIYGIGQNCYKYSGKVFGMYDNYYKNLQGKVDDYMALGMIGGTILSLPFMMYSMSDKKLSPSKNTANIIIGGTASSLCVGLVSAFMLPILIYAGPIVVPIGLPIYAYQKVSYRTKEN